MEFRIGVNLGDVMVEGEQIYGDGVNVAARLESLADPGGVCISGTVHEQVRDKLTLSYEDLGEQAVKNIVRPVRVWRVLMNGTVRVPEAASASFQPRQTWRSSKLSRWARATAAITALLVVAGYAFYRTYQPQILAAKEIYLPRILPKAVEQKMGFCTASDGVH